MARSTPARSALEHQAPHLAHRVEGTIPVRAKRRGYYDHHLKEEGDVFNIVSLDELGSWMELVSGDTPSESADAGNAGGAPSTEPDAPKAEKGKKAEKAKDKPKAGAKTENDVL